MLRCCHCCKPAYIQDPIRLWSRDLRAILIKILDFDKTRLTLSRVGAYNLLSL